MPVSFQVRCHRFSTDRGETGFTLVEVMVAMFVISLGLLAVLPLQMRSARTIGLADERQQATALATQAIEQVRDAALSGARARAIATGGWTTPRSSAGHLRQATLSSRVPTRTWR